MMPMNPANKAAMNKYKEALQTFILENERMIESYEYRLTTLNSKDNNPDHEPSIIQIISTIEFYLLNVKMIKMQKEQELDSIVQQEKHYDLHKAMEEGSL